MTRTRSRTDKEHQQTGASASGHWSGGVGHSSGAPHGYSRGEGEREKGSEKRKRAYSTIKLPPTKGWTWKVQPKTFFCSKRKNRLALCTIQKQAAVSFLRVFAVDPQLFFKHHKLRMLPVDTHCEAIVMTDDFVITCCLTFDLQLM